MLRRPGQRTAARQAIFENAMRKLLEFRPARVLVCVGGRADQLTGVAALRENGWLDFSARDGEWTGADGRELTEVVCVSFPPGSVLQVEWLLEDALDADLAALAEEEAREAERRESEVGDAPRRLTRTAH